MMVAARSWIKENSALVYFLAAQAVAAIGVLLTITAYMTRLEGRVNTLEIRGSPHLSTIDNRLSVLEAATRDNKNSIDRIVNVMTKELLMIILTMAGCNRGRWAWVEEEPAVVAPVAEKCRGGTVNTERRVTDVTVLGRTRNTITRTDACLD